jgi:hypothetical protein
MVCTCIISRHVALLYGMYFVLGSMITFVRKGHIASPEKAAMHVEKKVYRATAHHLLHESKATPNRRLCELGPHIKKFEPSWTMIMTKMILEMIVHIAKTADKSLLSSNRKSQHEHMVMSKYT